MGGYFVGCPYCKAMVYPNQEMWDYIDGEEHDVQCSDCMKTFVCTIEREIELYATKKEN